MNFTYDIWKLLAGVAFFLLAMNIMEQSIHSMAGRTFKLFLKKHTGNPVKAMGGGALVSALLQSSSIVNLLVLGMVGAGVFQMQHSLAMILGSNLGTTFTSWLMLLLGFEYDIDSIFMPLVAVSGLIMSFTSRENSWHPVIRFIFSVSFLFISLSFIKSGMEGWVQQTNLGFFEQYPSLVYILIGAALTAVVQSSSATMALTLSALHTGAIGLYMAMGVILGSEIGTTLKLFVASAKGLAVKKRVALANFLFNVVTTLVVWIFLQPLFRLITVSMGIHNALYALVIFQTAVNLICILIFFPFLKSFGKFLLNRFQEEEDESQYISKVPVTHADMAMDALEMETRSLINHVMDYSLDSFGIKKDLQEDLKVHRTFDSKTLTEKYAYIKHLHGEMHGFCLRLQNVVTGKNETERLSRLSSSIRNTMYAAKNIQDAQHDIHQIRNSSNDAKYQFYLHSSAKLLSFYREMIAIVHLDGNQTKLKRLTQLQQHITRGYSESLEYLYHESLAQRVNEIEISTLINFNRELYTSFKSMIIGMKDFLLNAKESEYFDTLPGFIR